MKKQLRALFCYLLVNSCAEAVYSPPTHARTACCAGMGGGDEPTPPAPEVDVGAPACASIHDAVVKQDRRSVAWYLQRQADCVLQRDEDGRTPLLLAAAAGDASTCTLLVRRMVSYDADAINWADAGGLTPLHWALTQQRYDAAALLLRHGASSSAEDAMVGGSRSVAAEGMTTLR